jgi:hypothetical protein
VVLALAKRKEQLKHENERIRILLDLRDLRKALREGTTPLEPMPGDLLKGPFHLSLQKIGRE